MAIEQPRRRIYGRRRGRRLRPGRRRLLEELLPRLSIDPAAGPIDPARLFERPLADLWLEVGFGSGEHLAAQASAHPDIGMIGCEPFVNGVAKLLSRIAANGLDNIRVVADDAGPLIDALPRASVGRVFVLFPDPWPKKRHHRRRFVSPANLDALARIMRDGGELRLASDDMGYIRWMLFHTLRHGAFEWLARGPRDWRDRPADWPETRYEQKAKAAGAACVYLRFRRRFR
jgi:tRNA (guanine-N7-)-methyltransferase